MLPSRYCAFCWSVRPTRSRPLDVSQDAAVEPVELGLCLLSRNARVEPREQTQPKCLTILVVARLLGLHEPAQRERNKDQRAPAAHRARETFGRDSDDRERLIVDHECVADHVQIAAEPVLPIAVTQDGDERFADARRVLRADQAPERRLQVQGTEVVA